MCMDDAQHVPCDQRRADVRRRVGRRPVRDGVLNLRPRIQARESVSGRVDQWISLDPQAPSSGLGFIFEENDLWRGPPDASARHQ